MRETLATILWEGWTALVLCAAAVFLPGSEALTYPAVLWPGLVLAAAVPAGWAFWALAEFAGAGASVPLLGFGHLLAKGVRTAVAEKGAIGILTGGLTAASAGITASLVCGVVCSLVGKSHDQN